VMIVTPPLSSRWCRRSIHADLQNQFIILLKV